MENPKKSKRPAKPFFVAAIISFALSMVVSLATQGFRPSTQLEAIIPGLLMGILGWIAIIGLVKWLSFRKK